MTHLRIVTPGVSLPLMTHPALLLIEQTKDRAAEARDALEQAEREHHDAILAAVALPSQDEPDRLAFSVAEVATAAGVSRSRIYKRINRPVYGDRDALAAS